MNLHNLLLSGGGLFFLLTLVEITPIKINPWSWILGGIGKIINKEIIEKVEVLEDSVQILNDNFKREKAINSRVRILEFSDSVMHKVKHSKESFNQVLKDIDEYERYCEEHPEFENNMTVIATKRIKQIYEKCSNDNDFL